MRGPLLVAAGILVVILSLRGARLFQRFWAKRCNRCGALRPLVLRADHKRLGVLWQCHCGLYTYTACMVRGHELAKHGWLWWLLWL